MDEALQDQFAALENEVRAAALPADCRHTALWCLGQLPPLYAQFRRTSESRYGGEITRLVRSVLNELAKSQKACPEAQALAASMPERLRLIHEQFGLPALDLKPPGASPPRPRKAG
jgi:hypothetical protein